jgi:hypothetical protein
MIEDEIKKKLGNYSLPSKPKSFGTEYYFPDNISTLPSSELGDWMFKLAAWKGYSLRMLANLEIERTLIKGKHDNLVSMAVSRLSTDNRRVTRDYALGKVIEDGGDFKNVRQRLITKEAEVESLKQVVEIYAMQIEVISREISRRTLELKLMQSGIGSAD